MVFNQLSQITKLLTAASYWIGYIFSEDLSGIVSKNVQVPEKLL
jgi:hypothetical protein